MALLVGFGVGLIYLAFLPPGIYSVDGTAMVALAESLATDHDFVVSEGLGTVGRGGEYYSSWYPLPSILGIPFVGAGLGLGKVLGLPGHYLALVSAQVLTVILSAATVGLVVLFALRLGAPALGACLAGVSLGLGTVMMVYGRSFFAEPLLALLVVAGLYLAVQGTRRGIMVSSLLAGLAVLAKPTGVLLAPVLSAYILVRLRSVRLALAPLAGMAVGLALFLAYNYLRYEDVFWFGQPYSFALDGVAEGLAGQLVSPGRGLIWYAPPVLIGAVAFRYAYRSIPLETLALVALFGGFLLIHSLWSAWEAGWSWGPRYLVPVLPVLLIPVAYLPRGWRKGVMVLTALGFLVNAPTLVSFFERYYSELRDQGVDVADHAVVWSPSYAPALHAWGAAVRQIGDAADADVRALIAQADPAAPAVSVEDSQLLRVVAVWWWMLPAAGIPRLIGALLATFMVLLGGGLIVQAFIFWRGHVPEGSCHPGSEAGGLAVPYGGVGDRGARSKAVVER